MWMTVLIPGIVTSLSSSNIYGTSQFTKQLCIHHLIYPDDKPTDMSYHYRDEETEIQKGHPTCPKS